MVAGMKRKAISLHHPLVCWNLRHWRGIFDAYVAGVALRCTHCPCAASQHREYTFASGETLISLDLRYWDSLSLEAHRWEV